MAKYCIIAAKPKGATNHCNSEFKMLMWSAEKSGWQPLGWKEVSFVSDLLRRGHQLLTGNLSERGIKTGAAVEVELRIVENKSDYKISDMPDK